ncbi:MAG TPA: M50 family metallopeptidase, partial [bacterium]|nr:M50 family metallopeptidase [bacterium]
PLRIHWTAPLGALFFGHFRFVPGFWIGFLVLILFHEMGHAAFVLANGARATSVDVHGLGGLCWWNGRVTPMGRAAIAWGGVLAQALLGVLAWQYFRAVPPDSAVTAQLAWVFSTTNLWMIGINLIPVRPLDGAEAWPIVPMLLSRATREGRKESRALKAAQEGVRTAALLKRLDEREDSEGLDHAATHAPPEIESLVEKVLDDAKRDPAKK